MRKFIVLVSLLMVISSMSFASDVELDVITSEKILLGYASTSLYGDEARPVNKPISKVTGTITSKGLDGSRAIVSVRNAYSVVVEANLTLTGTQTPFELTLPDKVLTGDYVLLVQVGNRQVTRPISLLRNYAEDAEIGVNVSPKVGKEISNLNDSTFKDFVVDGINKATVSQPHIITLTYDSEVIINQLKLWSNYGDMHGVKDIQVKNNNQIIAQSTIDWSSINQGNTAERVAFELDLNSTKTKSLEIIILDSHVKWGNTSVVTELQTWGKLALPEHNLKTEQAFYNDGDITNFQPVNVLNIPSNKLFSVERLSILSADKTDQITVRASIKEDTTYYEDLMTITPAWTNFGDSYLCHLNLPVAFITDKLQLDFASDLKVQEIFMTGSQYENLAKDASISLNGTPIAHTLADNKLSSEYLATWSTKPNEDVYLFDFTPYVVDLDKILYPVHFQSQQGVKTMSVAYYDQGNWHELESKSYQGVSNNQLKELFEYQVKKSSSKFKVVVKDANFAWEKYVLPELIFQGDKSLTATSVMNSVEDISQPAAGDKTLTLPEVHEDYQVSIVSSSDSNIISLTGQITPSSVESQVTLSLEVSHKTIDDKASKTFVVRVPKKLSENEVIKTFEIDSTSFIKNPSMGWIQYVEGFECRNHDHDSICTVDPTNIDEFWRQMDVEIAKGLQPSALYMRFQWSWYEPSEGQYAWNDPNSELSQLVKGAFDRDLQIAFRVLVDSTDAGFQSTPQWVFDAGATSYNSGTKGYLDPYVDNPIFMDKLGNFIEAFGLKYNSMPNKVSHVDGMGLGNWGEMHDIRTNHGKTKIESIEEVLKLYDKAFPDVLLGSQLDSAGDMLAIDKYNYMVRRDSYGSVAYLGSSTKSKIASLFDRGVPTIAENCFHHFQEREDRWKAGGPLTYPDDVFKTMEEMMARVVSDAIETRANALDIRVLEDAKLWVVKAPEKILEVTRNLGYRLTPNRVRYENKLKANSWMSIEQSWRNTGVGLLPNKNARWHNKYQVAYALLDSNNQVVSQYNIHTDEINPGDWLKEDNNNVYSSKVFFDNITAGDYILAVAIIDKTTNKPGINLAVVNPTMLAGGWLKIGGVTVLPETLLDINMNDFNKISGDGLLEKEADLLRVTASENNIFIGSSYDMPDKGRLTLKLKPLNEHGRFTLIYKYNQLDDFMAIGYDVNGKWFWDNGVTYGTIKTDKVLVADQSYDISLSYHDQYVSLSIDNSLVFSKKLPLGIKSGDLVFKTWYKGKHEISNIKISK